MNQTKLSYLLIALSLGCILLVGLYRLLGGFHNQGSQNQDKDAIISTQHIIEQPNQLPAICQTTISMMTCILQTNQLSENEQSVLGQGFTTLISQRNSIQSTSELQGACTEQYNYLLSLSQDPYQTIIQSCRKE